MEAAAHLAGFKDGWPHVHTHQPIICQAWLDQTCSAATTVVWPLTCWPAAMSGWSRRRTQDETT